MFHVLGTTTEVQRQSAVHVSSVRLNTLPTRKTVSEKTTTCIWIALSYEVWHSESLLKNCKLCPDVFVGWEGQVLSGVPLIAGRGGRIAFHY